MLRPTLRPERGAKCCYSSYAWDGYHRPSFGSASNLHHPRVVISILTLTKISYIYIAYTWIYTFKIKFFQFENTYTNFFFHLGIVRNFLICNFSSDYVLLIKQIRNSNGIFFFYHSKYSKLRFSRKRISLEKKVIIFSQIDRIEMEIYVYKVHKVYKNIKNIKVQKYV